MAGCGMNWGHLASWLDRWRNRLGEARSERYSSISEVSRVYFARVHLGLVVVLWNFLGPAGQLLNGLTYVYLKQDHSKKKIEYAHTHFSCKNIQALLDS